MQFPTNLTELSEQLEKLPQQKIAKVISALMLCYIAYLLAQFTWLVATDNKIKAPINIQNNASSNDVESKVNINIINQLHLFGKYTEQKTVEEERVEEKKSINIKK